MVGDVVGYVVVPRKTLRTGRVTVLIVISEGKGGEPPTEAQK